MTSTRYKKILWILLGGAVVVTAASITMLVLSGVPKLDEPVVGTVTYSVAEPSTVKPPEDYAWSGAPNHPKKIIIPDLGVNGFVQNVGVDQNNQIAVPTNTHIAGWFVDSVLPGEKGLSIIDGHIDVRPNSEAAIFQNLDTIAVNAEFQVVLGDDSVKRFRVLQVKTVPLDEAADILFSSIPGIERQLNLITCSGVYEEAVQTFSERVIVSAELLSED
jgi:sortase (surface protein transpeptidase)